MDAEENTDNAMDVPPQGTCFPAIGIDVWSTFDDHGRHVEAWKPWTRSSRCYMVVYTRVDAFSAQFPPIAFHTYESKTRIVYILNECEKLNLRTIRLRSNDEMDVPHEGTGNNTHMKSVPSNTEDGMFPLLQFLITLTCVTYLCL
jgi:hypothetical protein